MKSSDNPPTSGAAVPSPSAMPSAMRGVIAMALSMALFVSNDTLLKLATFHVPVSQAIAMRTLAAGVLFFILVVRAGELNTLVHALHPRVLVRSGLDTVTTFFYVAALAVMPIASTSTIYMAAPLITTALAVPMLGEKVGWKSWSAIVVGFAGAVVVTRPDPDTFTVMALLPLFAAFTGAVRDISTRDIGKEIPGTVVGLSACIVLTVIATACAFVQPWQVPTARDVVFTFGAALAFTGGTLALVYAFRNAPVASVSPLRYTLVFGAVLSGYVVFEEVPDAWTAVGIALVVGAGLYAIQHEHARSRAARKAANGGGGAIIARPVTCAPPSD